MAFNIGQLFPIAGYKSEDPEYKNKSMAGVGTSIGNGYDYVTSLGTGSMTVDQLGKNKIQNEPQKYNDVNINNLVSGKNLNNVNGNYVSPTLGGKFLSIDPNNNTSNSMNNKINQNINLNDINQQNFQNPNQQNFQNPNQQNFQNPNQVGQNKYQYTGPIQTLFGSANFGNGNNNQSQGNFNTSTGNLMGNYNFNQDNYNQGLRDTSTQGYIDSRQNFIEGNDKLWNGSFLDSFAQAGRNNQYRQDMRKNQADFTNANNLSSKNLEQQNQLGLQDLMSQRTTDLSQQGINQAKENQGVDNQYKYDYMDKYLLPQMKQQDSNQRANLDLQQQMHSGDIFKSNLMQDAYKSLQPSQETLNYARQNVMGGEMGKIWKNQLDNKLGGMTIEKYNDLINNSANQELGKEAQAKINYYNLISGNNNNSKQYGTEETELMLPDGTKKTTKIPLTSNNSNSVAKTTGKVLYDPKTGVTINN